MKKIFLISFLFLFLGIGQAQAKEGIFTDVSPNPAVVNSPVSVTVTVENKQEQFKFVYYNIDGKIQEKYDCNNTTSKYSSVNSCTKTFIKIFDKPGQYAIGGGIQDWSSTPIRGSTPLIVTLIIVSASGELPASGQGLQPTITTLRPSSGPLGTTIAISGTNLDCLLRQGPTVLFSQGINIISSVSKTISSGLRDCTDIETTLPSSSLLQPDQNVDVSILTSGGKKSNSLPFQITRPGATPPAVIAPPASGRAQKTGLVPCGPGTAKADCEFCDIFVMSSGILGWIFKFIVPTVATLMFIIGGVLFIFAGAKAEMFNKAKSIITAAVIGLLIIFGAWIIVNTVFDKIGVVELGSGWKWYDIQCKTP
ncbi:MAG: hypothetical protein Q7R84_01255 [bacterium]|nr:hypothetical protein [bacterium]